MPGDRHGLPAGYTDSQNAGPLLRDSIRPRLDFSVMHCPKYHEKFGFDPVCHIKDSRDPSVKTPNHVLHHSSEQVRQNNHRMYDASASNFSTDQRQAKHFVDRVGADLVADQLRRMYPRLAQDIEVTAVQPTGLTCSSDSVAELL